MFQEMNHIHKLYEQREHFESNLSSYCSSRNIFEKIVSKMKTLVSTFEGSEADVPAQIKSKIKELAEEGMKWAIKTAQNLNHLSQWSIMTPPDIQGNYSWFSLYQEDGAVVLTRQPWHQFVDEKEAIDIWKTFEKLLVSQHAAEKFGVETTHSQDDIKMMQEMMTPSSHLTIDGLTVYFFKLW